MKTLGPNNEGTKNYKSGLHWLVPVNKAGSNKAPSAEMLRGFLFGVQGGPLSVSPKGSRPIVTWPLCAIPFGRIPQIICILWYLIGVLVGSGFLNNP